MAITRRPLRWLTEFSRLAPETQFVVAKPFKLRGVTFNRGECFDVKHVTRRKLRQFYELRYVEIADDDVKPASPMRNMASDVFSFPSPTLPRRRGRPPKIPRIA